MNEKHYTITEWGKDHWSLIAYIEYRGINHKGVLNKDHLRIKNPIVANSGDYPLPKPEWKPEYGTRLRGYFLPDGKKDDTKLVPDHDDLDCIEDMEKEGVVENLGTGLNPACRLTKKGQVLAAALNVHKQEGSTFVQFSEAIENTLADLGFIPKHKCTCGYEMDTTKQYGGNERPSAGDPSICFNCLRIWVFNDDLTMREPKPLEQESFANDPDIDKTITAIKEAKKRV